MRLLPSSATRPAASSFGLLALATVLALPSAPALGAQGTAADSTVSAPVSNIHYEVRADRVALAMRRLHVTTTFDVAQGGAVVLSLPAWTPGAY